MLTMAKSWFILQLTLKQSLWPWLSSNHILNSNSMHWIFLQLSLWYLYRMCISLVAGHYFKCESDFKGHFNHQGIFLNFITIWIFLYCYRNRKGRSLNKKNLRKNPMETHLNIYIFNCRCRPYSSFTFFIAHYISAFKHVKDKKWH